MSGTLLAYVENDNALWIVGLRDSLDAYVTGATVRCTGIVDAAGNAVTGGSFPITLSYQADTTVGDHEDGNYLGILPDEIAFVDGESYTATVTVTSAEGNAKFSAPFRATMRTVL